MDLRKSFGVNADQAENGKWFDLEDGGSVKVAKFGNPKWVAELVRLRKPHLATIRTGTLSDEVTTDITVKAMAKGILLDWKNISIDGEEFHHSLENAEKILHEYPEFREAIAQIASDRKSFSVEDIAGK